MKVRNWCTLITGPEVRGGRPASSQKELTSRRGPGRGSPEQTPGQQRPFCSHPDARRFGKRLQADRFSSGLESDLPAVPEFDPRERATPLPAPEHTRARKTPRSSAASHLRPPGPRGRQGPARSAHTRRQQRSSSHLPGACRRGRSPIGRVQLGAGPCGASLAASADSAVSYLPTPLEELDLGVGHFPNGLRFTTWTKLRLWLRSGWDLLGSRPISFSSGSHRWGGGGEGGASPPAAQKAKCSAAPSPHCPEGRGSEDIRRFLAPEGGAKGELGPTPTPVFLICRVSCLTNFSPLATSKI